MKKIILSLALLAALATPHFSYALTPTYIETQDRLATLEAQVKDLQMQNQTLIANLNMVGAATSDTARMSALENRVLVLEKTVSLIQQNVMSVLQSVLSFLQGR